MTLVGSSSFLVPLPKVVRLLLTVVQYYAIPSGEVMTTKTIEAIQKVKRIKDDSSLGKTYSDVEQMMEELHHRTDF